MTDARGTRLRREDLQRYRQLNAQFEKLLQTLAKADASHDSQEMARLRIFDFKAKMNAIEARWPEITASEWKRICREKVPER